MAVSAGPHRITGRAVAIGLGGAAVLSWCTPYSDLVLRGTWLGLTAFPIGSCCLLLALVVANAAWRRAGGGLSSTELLCAYAMMLVAAGLSSFGLTGLVVPYAAGPVYFARPENHYAETVLRHLPRWLFVPQHVATALYEGLPPGRRVPLSAWAGPVIGWGTLVTATYLLLAAGAEAVRRPWIVEERLVFPLVQLPYQLAQYEPATACWPGLLRSPLVWTFFLVPVVVHGVNGLHYHVPAVPAINIHQIDIGASLTGRAAQAVQPLWLRFLFTVIGLTYLLPSELGFSLWFFYLCFLAQQVIAAQLGFDLPFVQAYPVRRFVALQMIGGVMMVGGALVRRMWAARHQASDASRRTTLAITCAGAALLAIWADLVGGGPVWCLALMGCYLLFQLVGTRLVAEAGMLYVQHPFRPLNLVLSAVGTAGPTPPRLPALALLDHLWMVDNRSPLQAALLQGLKLAELAAVPARHLWWAMAAAVAVAVPLSLVSTVRLLLTHGGTMLNPWFTSYYVNNLYCSWTTHLVLNGESARPGDFGWLALGAGTMAILMQLHHAFWRWPLNPVGYLMGASWPMVNFWFPILVGWLLKTLTLRYGGARAYRQLLPGFLALILGEYASAGLWVLIDALAGVHGHEIFSF